MCAKRLTASLLNERFWSQKGEKNCGKEIGNASFEVVSLLLVCLRLLQVYRTPILAPALIPRDSLVLTEVELENASRLNVCPCVPRRTVSRDKFIVLVSQVFS
jgi:hypothetical protein